MGVVNTKATVVTNADTVAHIPNNPHLMGADLQAAVGTVTIAASDSNTSTYRLSRVKSGYRVHSIRIQNDAITGGTSFQLGLYDTAANGGAVVSANLFATALDLSAGNVAGTDVAFQNNSVGNVEKRIWELLALSADPFKDYDLVLTAVTIGTSGGKVSAAITWAQ